MWTSWLVAYQRALHALLTSLQIYLDYVLYMQT